MRLILRALPPLAATLLLAAGVVAAPAVGSKAPDLTAKGLNGKPFRLSQLLGKSPLLVNFFSIT